jgi:hypothetical protein
VFQHVCVVHKLMFLVPSRLSARCIPISTTSVHRRNSTQ